jgi:molybdate transport system substrate-binding protein
MRSAALVLAVAAALAACGDGGGEAAAGEDGDTPRLVVSAAASMTEALEACAPEFADADVRLQFGGSDELAAQIRQGVTPDVYAAANTTLPQELHDEGLLYKPVESAPRTSRSAPTPARRSPSSPTRRSGPSSTTCDRPSRT